MGWLLGDKTGGSVAGRDAAATLARHLVNDRGHHRIVIDPATDNGLAIRCYQAVGFRPVGVMRRYGRDVDGRGWHDGLLMAYLPKNLARSGSRSVYEAPGSNQSYS